MINILLLYRIKLYLVKLYSNNGYIKFIDNENYNSNSLIWIYQRIILHKISYDEFLNHFYNCILILLKGTNYYNKLPTEKLQICIGI